jgi:predicted XRE-type DNA-binding protein
MVIALWAHELQDQIHFRGWAEDVPAAPDSVERSFSPDWFIADEVHERPQWLQARGLTTNPISFDARLFWSTAVSPINASIGAPRGATTSAEMRIKMTKARTFANVWEAIEDSPEDAATMTMRSNVMSVINEKVRGWNTTQTRAARRLGITQPRLNDLLHGKINKFSLDAMLILATRAGLKIKIDIRSAAWETAEA